MPSTTNFGWTTPADTDLVKDGASAIRTLGNGIDTTLVDLKGGTTGQVLSKNSNTDMDFTWVAQDDSNAIQNALLTTTGDTIYASGASTPARLGIGTTGQVLTVSGGVPSWATPSAGAYTELATGSLSGSSVTINSISGSYTDLLLYVYGQSSSAGVDNAVRFNGVTSNSYQSVHISTNTSTVSTSGGYDRAYLNPGSASSGICFGMMNVRNYSSTASWKVYNYLGMRNGLGWTGGGIFESANAITSLTIMFDGTATFASGNYKLYGVK